MNFYKRFVGDFMRKTAHLSLLQNGAYNMLLDTYYATGRPLPADRDALYNICRATKPIERQAVDYVADAFFPVNGDGSRHNTRADEEIADHEERMGVNRLVGNLGGRPKGSLQETERLSGKNRTVPKNKPSQSQSQKEQKQSAFALPSWVPVDAWNAYVEMRKSIKRPLTKWAAELAVRKLEELRKQGHPPEAVLNHSTFNSWQGLYEPKGPPANAPRKVAL